MKSTYRYLTTMALSALIALPALAQRPSTSSGSSSSRPSPSPSSSPSSSGSSYRPSSSSSSSSNNGSSYRPAPSSNPPSSYRPAPSYNPPSSVNNNRPGANLNGIRPSYNNNYRPGTNNPRVAIAPPRVNSQGIRPPVTNLTPGYRSSVNPGSYVNRDNVGVGTRGYVGAGGRGSVGAGGRGFYPSGYWGQHHYYHYNRGYFNTYYAPRLGFSIGFLPTGYYPFYYGDYQYYYNDGLFYSYDNSEYTVVEPPVGAEVDKLPSSAQSIVINGEQYYEANGVYYIAVTKDDGTVVYQVAGKDGELNTAGGANDMQQAPQIGDIVETLPPDCRKININGEKYYVAPDGYYYQEARDANNNKVYKVVGTPVDEPEGQ